MISSCRFISTTQFSTPKSTYYKLKVYEYKANVVYDLFLKKDHYDQLISCEFGDYVDIDFGFSPSRHKLYVISVLPVSNKYEKEV